MGRGREAQSMRRYFESRHVPPCHCWTMVWGWEWKILLLLELKIAQGSRVRSLTHQAGGLGTEQQVRCPHRGGQR